MNISMFREMAMQSANTYHRFLTDKGKGVMSIPVREIKPAGHGLFLLSLASRLSAAAAADLESLQFQLNGQNYTAFTDIRPIEYSAVNATLLVKPKNYLLPTFSDLKPTMTVYSDLKFLVKRVEDWYMEHGNKIRHPCSILTDPPEEIVSVANPSEEQLTAIEGALSSPLSYIWGAPGTGKTRVILTSCAVSLLKNKKKMLILAPTNNSLEQMLLGLLPALCDQKIPMDQVIRLGIPTTRFANRYPAVCETTGISYQLKQISSEIKQIKECQKYRESCRRFESAKKQIVPLLAQFEEYSKAYQAEQAQVQSLELDAAQYRAKDALLRRESVQLLSDLENAQKALSSHVIKKIIFPGRYSRQRSAEMQAAQLLQKNTNQIESLAPIIAAFDREHKEHIDRCDSYANQLSLIKENLIQITVFWPSLQNTAYQISEVDPSGSVQNLLSALHESEDFLSEKTGKYCSYEDYSDTALASLLEELVSKEAWLRSATIEDRLKQANIVAATLDRFLAPNSPVDFFEPNHVFLDEAGYCSLIKGATLLSLGVPVTFLGDHMQLPPVCEINNADLLKGEYQNLCLWAQSTIYLDSVFSSTPEIIAQDYFDAEPPSYFYIQKYDLTGTYRFSSTLSNILAGCVYSSQLHSVSDISTELLVLDAPHRKELVSRTSEAEVDAIAQYLKTEKLQDYAILTPYRKQLAALAKRFPVESKSEHVLTVHASQGREWDTVFFSVVDTTDMWFVNTLSQMTKGKQVVNTAVSRAKKQLIIVCDSKFWLQQPKQLIGQLVQAAKKLN